MDMPPEVIMLAIYTLLLMLIILGIATGFKRLHRKLDRILLTLWDITSCKHHNSDNISDYDDRREKYLPKDFYIYSPEKCTTNDTAKHKDNESDTTATLHNESITNARLIKQLNANKTFFICGPALF